MSAPKIVAGRFQLGGIAGTGGMAAVWRGRDLVTGDTVAVKRVGGCSFDETARFTREAHALAKLEHPGIVRYVAHGREQNGALYLVMEWVDGPTLAEHLREAGPLGVDETVELGMHLASALGAVHACGIVHRDVKPGNVVLVAGRTDAPKLLDFGVARAPANTLVTQSGAAVGTLGYMAPEQVRGERGLSPAVDVFALGCLLFQCLAGQPPFAGEHVLAVLAKLVLDEQPRLRDHRPEVPPSLDALVARMLAKEPALRPPDGNAVAHELSALRAGSAARAGPLRALGASERRLICVLLATRGPRRAAPVDATVVVPRDAALAAVQEVADRHGGHAEPLGEAAVIVTLRGSPHGDHPPDDPPLAAARCALDLRGALPEASWALTLVHAEPSAGWAVGAALDRAATLSDQALAAGAGSIVVDEGVAALLAARFLLVPAPGGSLLLGEHEAMEPARTLLGRVTPFVGRRVEMASLRALYDESVAERAARAAVITAPPGSGKSRLARELCAAITSASPRPLVLHGRGEAAAQGSPFAVIAGVLRRLLRLGAADPASARSDKLRQLAAATVGAAEQTLVLEFLGELIGAVPPSASDSLRTARADARIMGERVRAAFEALIEGACRSSPVVLVLEDAHWCDRPSLELCGSLLRDPTERQLFLLMLARGDTDPTPSSWEGCDLSRIRLPPLPRSAARELARAVLDDAPEPMLHELCERAGGNVFYLEELLRAAAEGRGEHAPETVLALVEGRLAALDPQLRRALRAGSIFGQVFWLGGLVEILGGAAHADATRAALAVLVDRELVCARDGARFAGEHELAFVHDLVREAAYRMLTEEDRRLGHRLAGAWLEARGEVEAARVAAHHEAGGEVPRARAAWAEAAAQALEAGDLTAAEQHAQRAVDCGVDGLALARVLGVLAEVAQDRGDAERARGLAGRALQTCPRQSRERTAALLQTGLASFRLGDVASLEAVATALHEELQAEGAAAASVIAAARVAICLEMAARPGRAGALLAIAESLTVEPGGRAAAWRFRARAIRALCAGDVGAYLELELAAAERLEMVGASRDALSARVNAAFGWLSLGAADEAERGLRAAIVSAERLGLWHLRATALWNLGVAREERGDLDGAERFYQSALDARACDRRVGAGARIELARVLARRGNVARAEREARAAVELAAGSGAHARALAALAEVLLAAGNRKDALETAEQAAGRLADHGPDADGEATVRLVLAEVLARAGDPAAARGAIDEARARLVERAARIADARWRQSFLERVRDHRRTFELADTLGAEALGAR